MASVTPICTAEKNRFGSCASLAAFWPRLPRLASALIWPSRSETRAISEAAKNPPMQMMTRTTMMSRTTLLTSAIADFLRSRIGMRVLAPEGSSAAGRTMCLASLDRIT